MRKSSSSAPVRWLCLARRIRVRTAAAALFAAASSFRATSSFMVDAAPSPQSEFFLGAAKRGGEHHHGNHAPDVVCAPVAPCRRVAFVGFLGRARDSSGQQPSPQSEEGQAFFLGDAIISASLSRGEIQASLELWSCAPSWGAAPQRAVSGGHHRDARISKSVAVQQQPAAAPDASSFFV